MYQALSMYNVKKITKPVIENIVGADVDVNILPPPLHRSPLQKHM